MFSIIQVFAVIILSNFSQINANVIEVIQLDNNYSNRLPVAYSNDLEINITENSEKGNPLILTPLIEQGKFDEARRLSVVKPFLSNIKSHSGYFTVNKEYNSNLFFWFFKCENDWKNAPVSVWLQGGPGASGLLGLFLENGPYILNTKNSKLIKRYHSWHKYSNMIFIDNPVGTGYSFTESKHGYLKNQTSIGESLYVMIKQFFMMFPNLLKNDFFITGESYAGKYIPAFGYTIHKYNNLPENDFKINLQGLFIGNGLTDPVNMLVYGDYIYQLGLIDDKQLKVFKSYEIKIKEKIDKNDWNEATDLFGKMVLGYVYYPQGAYFNNVTGITEHYNYVDESSGTWTKNHSNFINSTFFRKSLHIGDTPYGNTTRVAMELKEDIMKSVLPWVVELLNHYRIVFYNGQLDIICAYPLTENFLRNMRWKGSAEYANTQRKIWKVGNKVAGYYKSVDNLTEVLVRNAGHLVPTDQPLWSHVLFHKFITNSPLSKDDHPIEEIN